MEITAKITDLYSIVRDEHPDLQLEKDVTADNLNRIRKAAESPNGHKSKSQKTNLEHMAAKIELLTN